MFCPWEWSAARAGVAQRRLQADPARPMQRLRMLGLLAPSEEEQFTEAERDLLLRDGIATWYAIGAAVYMERNITMYQLAAGGSPDTAFLDVNTHATLGYIRYDVRSRINLQFPNHKLADDGTKFGEGQAIVTPGLMRGVLLNAFRDWELLGLVEDFDQFKTDLLVERNDGDSNRMDIRLPVNVVNQARVFAVQVQFLL